MSRAWSQRRRPVWALGHARCVLAIAAGCAGLGAASPAGVVGADAGPAATAPAAQKTSPGKIRAPSRRAGSWTAKVLLPTVVRSAPGGGRKIWRAKPQTEFNHQSQRLLILARRRAPNGEYWLRVRLPIRPNDTAGWVPLDRVLVSRTRYWITIDVSQRRVSVHKRGRLKRRTGAVVGEPSTPTPRGLFAFYESVRQNDPTAFLGTWALHLTAHSDVLENFGGGDGRVAVHGRAGTSLNDPLGTAASHGCIRIDNGFINWLARVAEAGTPVRIVR